MKYFLPKIPLLSETILPITNIDLEGFKPIPPQKDNKIAIIMSHFLRDKILLNTLNSIFAFQPGCKIYIADQGVYDENLEKLYAMLTKCGHQIIYAGYDAGISRCRNLLVKASTEPYIYWQDDDDCFLSDTDLNKAVKVLEKNDDIGVVGFQAWINGKIEHYEMFLNIENRKIDYIPAWTNPENDQKPFIYCDMVLNNAMARREIFEKISWDERLKLAEHLDFFLQLKYNTEWKVVYTDIFIQNQGIKIDDPSYKLFRGRNVYFWQYYIEKWNVNYIHNLEFKSNSPWKIKLYTTNSEEQKIYNTIDLPSENIPEQKEDFIEKYDVVELLKLILSTNENIWLLNNSCLEAVIYNELKNNKLELGVKTAKEKSDILKLTKNNKIPIEITVEEHRKIKPWKLYRLDLFVPCPVVSYLEHYTNKTWDKLKNE